ncbi:MAG: molybdopterin molybdotransferase MoeA [Synergistales bacterium]|nr:molybdopterin molybdotransferase MoeA [Synergistales bacterium]
MAGLVREVITREEAIHFVMENLAYPWDHLIDEVPLEMIHGRILAKPVYSPEDHPPFDRSLRDGFAVIGNDTKGSSHSAPSFLEVIGEVPMGRVPELTISSSQAAVIHTGGMVPPGADAVVMVEDTVVAGRWVEVRKSVQSGENIIHKGEEIRKGQLLLEKGFLMDFRSAGVLAHAGMSKVPVISLQVGVISTGDEIVPVSKDVVHPGCVRDVNSWMIQNLLTSRGFHCFNYGIVQDNKKELREKLHEAYEENDAVILTGGSSVSVRDFCSELFEEFSSPGLMVRGISIKPGKPTLIAGSLEDHKVLFGLPGHPLSCMVVALNLVLPLLVKSIAIDLPAPATFSFPCTGDIFGRTGVEEYIPCRIVGNGVFPMMAKSGYISALNDTDGFIRLTENQETMRKGDMVEVIPW